MKNCLRHPIRGALLQKSAFALDVGAWLFRLPVVFRIHTIPMLFERLGRQNQRTCKPSIGLNEAVTITTCVCNLRPFRSRIFPKQCLRQSLALYRTLTRMGYPVEIHFGVLKGEKNLYGHSWVTIEGQPVADTAHGGLFKTVYSHSSIYSPLAASDRRKIKSLKNVAVPNRA